jgi:hypothetical protein
MKKILLVGAVVVVVAGAGYGILKMQTVLDAPQTAETPTVADSPVVPPEPEHVTGSDSLQSLIALGRTLKCGFHTSDGTTTTDGTAYFNNGKLRVETAYTGTSSVAESSNLIINGDTMYTWAKTKAGSFAIKMPTASISSTTASSTTHRDGEVSLQNKVTYDCMAWDVDDAVFVPPADVSFMDMGAMMKGLPTLPSGMMGGRPTAQ